MRQARPKRTPSTELVVRAIKEGFAAVEYYGSLEYVVCEMCQGTTPKGKPCEYCGRATDD